MSTNALAWREIWADNSNPDDINRGIICFARMCFPDIIYNDIPQVQKDIYRDLLQLYNPKYTFAQERQFQEIVARGFGKSTISSFIFPTYLTCMNGFEIKIADWDRDDGGLNSLNGILVEVKEDLIVIMSETGTMAENWITQIRGAIANNRYIKQVFGNLKNESVKDDEGKWTRNAFTVIKDNLKESWQRGKGLTLLGKGVNMQIRGINVKGRPTLIIFDDLYSLGNTKTPESRAKIRYIANAEAKNSLDPVRGKIVSIGTVVHEDTIVVDYKKSKFWHTVEYQMMDKVLFDEVINQYCRIDREKNILYYPSSEECKKLEKKGYITHWPDRWTLEMLLTAYAEKIESRTESIFWQEFFHITLAEEDKRIRQDMVRWVNMDLVSKQIGGHWYSFVRIDKGNEEYDYRHVNLGLGIDMAISYKISADNSAIILVGMDYYGRLYIIKNQSGKYGISDEFKEDYINAYHNKLCTNYSHIARIGSIDEMFRWMLDKDGKISPHRPKFILEVNSIGVEGARQAKLKMNNYGMRYMMLEVLQTADKEERILDTLQPFYQSRSVYHNIGQEKIVYELEYLGKAKNDDNADIEATVVSQLTKPTQLVEWNQKEIKDDRYKKMKFLNYSSGSRDRLAWRLY